MPRRPAPPPLPAELLALLRAAKSTPEDDAPRLILADWLEERGTTPADQARAELIRAQCRLADLGADDPEHRSLQRRIKQLLSQHGKTWRGPLTATQGGRFERGLLYLDLPAAMLDRPRGAELAEHPALA